MTPLRLSPVPEGTRWPSGESVELAILQITADELTSRIGLPLSHGFEDGLGNWAGIGGRLPSGTDVEFICYARIPGSVNLRADKSACYSTTLNEALELIGLTRSDIRVRPLVDSQQTK
jgi:hypothetical protein